LRHRVENAEPRLGVAADRGGPSPAAPVGGEVGIDQLGGLKRLLQVNNAGVDELDPAVGRVGERIEDVPVENEGAHHLPRLFQRMVKGGMVEVAQIAAKPDQGAGVFRYGTSSL
jgi:hypothetical protein